MSKNKENPISLQSKEWLRDALFMLMEKEQFKKITITEIADSAKLNRRTFYRNFKTKDAIIMYHLDYLNELYVESLKEVEELSMSNITRVFFEFWFKQITFLELLEKNDLLYFLLDHLNKRLPYIYKLFKGHRKEYSNDDELQYALAYSVGGYWNTLKLWLKNGVNKTPQELAELIKKAIKLNNESMKLK